MSYTEDEIKSMVKRYVIKCTIIEPEKCENRLQIQYGVTLNDKVRYWMSEIRLTEE